MTRLLICLIVAVLAACARAPAQDLEPDSTEALLRELADTVLDEAERQHMVKQRMDGTIDGVRTLVDDLLSNDLLAQGRGPEMKRIVSILDVLTDRHVPQAAGYLEEAWRKVTAMHPNLQAADGEIQIIIEELDRLLRKAQPSGIQDDLLTQLRLVIRDQEQLMEQTREWGRALYATADAAKTDADELKTRQTRISASTRQFESNLRKAADRQQEPRRRADLQDAARVMEERKVQDVMTSAATDIEEKKAVPAVRQQTQALEALYAVEELLMEDSTTSQLDRMNEQKEALEDLLDRQQELTQDTRNTDPQEQPEQSREQELEQRNLRHELEQMTQNTQSPQQQPQQQ